ncbi:hypothetical protein HHI36_017295 [Cryptolaemus montrouzieri]|uniref:Uncharacterized protein n=1 Tax=Cryptolaemus montrouzieri TaxID=559131 RepID=A0ABD2NM35_9CUCU
MEEVPKCEISFNIARDHPSHLQIMVLEYPDDIHSFDEIMDDCMGKNNINFLTLKVKEKIIQVCDEFHLSKLKSPVFVHVSFEKTIHLFINVVEVFHSVKITATAGRALRRHEHCNNTFEIQCAIGKMTICINKALLCDNNINCGVFDENDEDYKICKASKFANLWIVVLAGLITVVLGFGIFVYLLKTSIAQITDNFFIFNEDEVNKLVIKSQLNTHDWQIPRRQIEGDPPCFCKTDSNINQISNDDETE